MELTINQNLIEETFCLGFELKAMRDLLINGEAERWVPGLLWRDIENEHLERYKFANKYVSNKKVLDLACGCGLGSFLLAEEGRAAKVIGCDLDHEAIRYANHRYYHENVVRTLGNAEEFRFDDKFDVVVSFETIEHLDNYTAFLKNVKAGLIPNGLFIVSTPITLETNTNCRNPFHKIEWSFNDFKNLLAEYFEIEEVYLQNINFHKRQPTVIERAWSKVFPKKMGSTENAHSLIKYTTQLNTDKIESGYQIVICKNIKL